MTAITKQLGLPDSTVDVRRLPTQRSERLSAGNCPKVVANDRKHRQCELNLHPKGLGKCQPVSCLHPLNREVGSSFRPNQRQSTTNHSMTLIKSTNNGGEAAWTSVFTALWCAPTIQACCKSNPYACIWRCHTESRLKNLICRRFLLDVK